MPTFDPSSWLFFEKTSKLNKNGGQTGVVRDVRLLRGPLVGQSDDHVTLDSQTKIRQKGNFKCYILFIKNDEQTRIFI